MTTPAERIARTLYFHLEHCHLEHRTHYKQREHGCIYQQDNMIDYVATENHQPRCQLAGIRGWYAAYYNLRLYPSCREQN